MAEKSIREGFEVWTIVSPDGQSKMSFVTEKGGVGSSLVLNGREWLYLHDFFWQKGPVERIPGGWPFLFPTCGRLERGIKNGVYLYDGHVYHLPSHGFGPRIPWVVLPDHTASALTLELTDTEETRKAYPFLFRVRLTYRIEDNGLVCEQSYTNTGSRPMPYYAGFHPYFLTPPARQGKEKVMLDYRPVRRLVYNESLTDVVGEGPMPDLPVPITTPDINEILSMVDENKETRLIYPDGAELHMKAEGAQNKDLFPYIQLYTMPDKPFFCVEPWMGFPNALNTVSGAHWLAPGAEDKGVLKVWTT
ncbi:MAG: aldose epimerase [Lentisphaerota bacterium]